MLTGNMCQQLLSTESEFSDTLEVEMVRDELYRLAQLAFDIYWSEVENGSKNPFGLLQASKPVDIV